jgi:NAD(P)-dependent dehydrogenase (short-subunit alcohol dehydrogenase family)
MNANKVWYVTGASKGLGLALVQKLLTAGYRVAATSRSKEALIRAIGAYDESLFLPLATDLTNTASIAQSVADTIAVFGRIDVVVNNAGYGIGGTVEELSAAEISESFGVNVTATIEVIQQVLPVMRAQRSGHIINISSIAGFAPATGWAVYAATKYAVMGLSEVLAEDVKELGIHVTVVAPGAFRTQFLSGESLVLSEKKIEDYQTVRASHARYLTMDGTQLGDPDKAADVFIALAEHPVPPVRLFLGSDAFKRAQAKIAVLQQEMEQWKTVSFSTDF